MRFAFIAMHCTGFTVVTMCRVLGTIVGDAHSSLGYLSGWHSNARAL